MGILIRHSSNQIAREDYALFKECSPISAFALPSFEYGYCLSVHKSQGSEYDHVLLLVPSGSEVFGRELLYTAVTRARRQFQIDGDEEVIRKAISRGSRKISGFYERVVCGL